MKESHPLKTRTSKLTIESECLRVRVSPVVMRFLNWNCLLSYSNSSRYWVPNLTSSLNYVIIGSGHITFLLYCPFNFQYYQGLANQCPVVEKVSMDYIPYQRHHWGIFFDLWLTKCTGILKRQYKTEHGQRALKRPVRTYRGIMLHKRKIRGYYYVRIKLNSQDIHSNKN